MTKYGNVFAENLIEWLIEAGFIKSQYQMSIYYKYVPVGTKIVVLYYADECVYRYTSGTLGKQIVDNLGKILHVNLLGYAHWFVSIRILG